MAEARTRGPALQGSDTVAEEAGGEHQECGGERDDGFEECADDAEGNREEPEDRPREEDEEGEWPAEREEQGPEKEGEQDFHDPDNTRVVREVAAGCRREADGISDRINGMNRIPEEGVM